METKRKRKRKAGTIVENDNDRHASVELCNKKRVLLPLETGSLFAPMADDSSRISFDSAYSASKYRMFEVSGDIADRIEKGMLYGMQCFFHLIRLYIKGEEAGSCVLTTSEEAFKLEKIETSNTVLLCVKEDSGRLVAKGVCGSYFEVGHLFSDLL